jgi:DNA-binding phage protein
MREYRTWREFLKEELANPEAAIDYLQVSLEEYQVAGDTSFFLQEVQTVIEAQGGVEEIAKRTAMAPETLSKILSSNEAPYLDTFATILNALGCRLSIEPLKDDQNATPDTETAEAGSAKFGDSQTQLTKSDAPQ